jgi:carbonic anhydrase
MEYSVVTFVSVLLMVLGHTDCGAVKATIEPAVQAVQGQPADHMLDAAIRQNVKLATQGLGRIPTFADPVQSGKLKIVGYEYQLHTGEVTAV